MTSSNRILVTGGTGKTGRRIVEHLHACITDEVERAIGRPPRDFADYARQTAATGVWNGQ